MSILVLAGTPQQFINFRHVFGGDYREVLHVHDLEEAAAKSRPLVLLIGTWYHNPLRDEVLTWLTSKDKEGRPRGQAFAKFGPGAPAQR